MVFIRELSETKDSNKVRHSMQGRKSERCHRLSRRYGDGGYNPSAPGRYGVDYGMTIAPYKMCMDGGYEDSHGALGGYPNTSWKTSTTNILLYLVIKVSFLFIVFYLLSF